MAKVSVDIPGIGLVEADNAASESTLRELVNIMKGAGGGAGGGGASGGGVGGAAKEATKNVDKFSKQTDHVSDKARALGTNLGKVALGAGYVSGRFLKLGEQVTETIANFADVGDSVESAAGMFKQIPLVGSVFGATAKAATAVADSFNKGTAAGATFGGSIAEMSRAAGQAGMTLDNFAGLIASNGEGMLAFGNNVDTGAKRFATLSKDLRTTSSDLYALGFSTVEINEGLASYGKQLRMQGLQRGKSDKELIEGAQDYLKEMDALAKITGETRKEQEAERERLMADAQFQASMAGINEDVRNSFIATTNQLPAGLRGFAKDILATGTATTAENQKLMSQMPRSAAMLADFNAKMQRGEAITTAERNRLNNLMAQEGGAALKNIKYAGAANSELAPLVNSLADTYKMQENAVVDAKDAQDQAAKNTDGMNEELNKARENLANMSNQFQMVLASSGILPILMDSFTILANAVSQYLVPAFGMFTNFISSFLYPTFLQLAGFVMVDLMPTLQAMGGIILDYVWPAFQAIGSFILDNLYPIFVGLTVAGASYLGIIAAQKVAMLAQTVALAGGLLPAIIAQTAATWAAVSPFLALAAPVIAVVAGITAMVVALKEMYDAGWTFSTFFQMLGDKFQSFGIMLQELFLAIQTSSIAKFVGIGIDAEEAAKRQAELDLKKNEIDARALEREFKREDERKKRGTDEATNDAKKQEEIASLDQKLLNIKSSLGIKTAQVEQKELDIKKQNLDATKKNQQVAKNLTDPLQMLIGEATQQKSGFIKSKPTAEIASNVKNLTTKQDDSKVVTSDASTTATASIGTQTSTAGQSPASQGTNELNSSIAQLVALTKQNNNLAEAQIRILKSLSGDLFA